MRLAHRVAWVLAGNELPAGACLLHKCDNPACINPLHLFLGSRRDNMHDMTRKGRNKKSKIGMPLGVFPHGRGYAGQITDGKRLRYLGTFDTIEEASAAVRQVVATRTMGG